MRKSGFSISNFFKILSKVVSWIIFAILLVFAAFLIYYYIATKIYASKGPGYEPKFSIYTIISPSMTPKIKVYDTIINVKVDDPSDIKKGDVITFISTSVLTPGTNITHRVIGITTDENGDICYQTKGDYNAVADQGCAKFNNILGKYVFKIPQLGRIQFLLASKAGWILLILIPALYILGKDVLRLANLSSIKKNVNKIDETNKKDSKKAKEEKNRKEELKRRLLHENKSIHHYYKEPEVKTIDKRKKQKEKK